MMILLILLTFVSIVTSQQPCGDGNTCKCTNRLIICEDAVDSTNIFDYLPPAVLKFHDHLIVHSTHCETYKSLTGTLSVLYPHLEVVIPKKCGDVIRDFNQEQDHHSADYHDHDDETDGMSLSTRNPLSIISLILTGIIIISLTIHVFRTVRVRRAISSYWQRVQLFKVSLYYNT